MKAVVLLAGLVSSSVFAADRQGAALVGALHELSHEQLELALLASSRTGAPKVTLMADRVIEDFSRLDDVVVRYAGDRGIPLAPVATGAGLEPFAELEGEYFDEEFFDAMVDRCDDAL